MKLDRFLNVARWNFAVNRSQYMKMALSLFLVMAIPFLTFLLKTIWVTGITRSPEIALASFPGADMGDWMAVSFVFALPIICGYTFHNLLTKQSRIKELTLPASNGEKFLFHAVVTVGGALLTYIVGFMLINIIQYFYVGTVYGFSNAEWISYSSIFFDLDSWPAFIICLGWLAFASTFVLGNALNYRHNVLWTFVFHMGLGFVSMLCLGMIMPMLIEVDWSWLKNFDLSDAETFVKTIFVTFFTLVIVACWWLSYYFYCHAQITTKRNK